MRKHVLMLSTSAFILACGVMAASAQQPAESHSVHENPGTMGRGMMGGGMMGHRGTMGPFVMRIIFALMDNDSDGTVSLQEFQAAHEKIFKAMDANKDGVLTIEEMRAFMQGTGKSVPKE